MGTLGVPPEEVRVHLTLVGTTLLPGLRGSLAVTLRRKKAGKPEAVMPGMVHSPPIPATE